MRDTGPGAGPVLLLLHGWTASADLNWFQAYGALAEVGRVVAVDHRGHGRGLYSEQPFALEDAADDAAAVLDALGIDRVVAVGYSMGGPIASLLCHRHPRKVAGLVLCATALEWRARLSERAVWKLLRGASILFKLGPPRRLMERYLRDAIESCPEIEDVRGWLVGELRRGDPIAVHQAGLALGRYDARVWAGALGVPAAVIVTTKDRLVRPRKQRALARAVGAQVFELPGDHDAALVQPGPFRASLTAAVASVLTAAPPAFGETHVGIPM